MVNFAAEEQTAWTKIGMGKPDSPSDYAVEMKDVWKTYKTGTITVDALQNVTFSIRRGECIAIVGPSGSGKSTLLNLLGTLDRPTKGSVLIDGVDLSSLKEEELAKLRNEKVGFIFQSYNLINRISAIRNVELAGLVKGTSDAQLRTRAKQLMALMGLQGQELKKPTEMSGGQQQRVAIARALINDPTILLADEPTGNLDSKTGEEVFNLLISLSHGYGNTVIIVTHNVELAAKVDRIIRMRDGRIEQDHINDKRQNPSEL